MKRIKIVIYVTFVMLGLLGDVSAQSVTSKKSLRSFKINKARPSIYISFERIGNIKMNTSVKTDARIWLRLHNNVSQQIWLEASGEEGKEYGDAKLYYDILKLGNSEDETGGCHVCSIVNLKPGKTILFSIPRGDIAGDDYLRLKFNYDWENGDDVAGGREVTHYVYFYPKELVNQ